MVICMTFFFDKINRGNYRSVAVKKNILGSLFVKGCSILISLAIVPMTLGYVDKEMYGVWLTLSQILVMLQFFDVGFSHGLKNRLTEALAKGDYIRSKTLVSTTYVMMLLIFAPLCVLLECLIPMINWSHLLKVSSSYNDDIILTLQVLILGLSIQMILSVINAVVDAFQKVALTASFPVIGNALALLCIVVLECFSEGSLLSLGLVFSFFPVLVAFVASCLLYSTKFMDVRPSVKMVDFSCVKDIMGLGVKFFVIQIQAVIMFQTTNLLISNISGPENVTYYGIAYRYVSVATMIINIIFAPLWPAFTDAYTKNDFSWMQRIYKKMTTLYIVSVAVMICMIAVSPFVYSVWIGDKVSIPFVMTLTVGIYTIVHTWDLLQVYILNGIGKILLQTYVTLIGLFCHIPLSLYLGQYIGCYGVLVSMTSIVFIYIVFFTIQIRKILSSTATAIWNK